MEVSRKRQTIGSSKPNISKSSTSFEEEEEEEEEILTFDELNKEEDNCSGG